MNILTRVEFYISQTFQAVTAFIISTVQTKRIMKRVHRHHKKSMFIFSVWGAISIGSFIIIMMELKNKK